ncbi:MAG: hypothetical protein MUF54_03015 [Polyangiaceae bacterium]|jgi:hypothetical protein|nr:hypothetical protein [Polyangiaceae bacterium]
MGQRLWHARPQSSGSSGDHWDEERAEHSLRSGGLTYDTEWQAWEAFVLRMKLSEACGSLGGISAVQGSWRA